MRSLALLLLAALASPEARAQTPGARHLRRARVTAEGPLSGLRLELAGGGSARMDVDLVARERRELVVAGVPSPLAPDEAPTCTAAGAGSVRFEGWIEEDRAQEEQRAARLSPGLRARPLPPAPANGGGLPGAGLLAAAGAFLLVVKLRERPLRALSAGVVGAALVLLVAAPTDAGPAHLRLLELEERSPWALEVLVARGTLPVPAGWHGRLATRPARAAVDVTMGEARWVLDAGRAELLRFRPLELPPVDFTPDAANALADLADVWSRSADGSWSHRGAWPLGEPLPAPRAGPGEPPGWLHPALPQGRRILIARLADPGALGGEGAPPATAWLRWIGA